MGYCGSRDFIIALVWQVGTVLTCITGLVEGVHIVTHIHLAVVSEDNLVVCVVRWVTGLNNLPEREVFTLGLEYLLCSELDHHAVWVVYPGLAIVTKECQSRCLANLCQIVGDVDIGGICKTCSIIVVVVVLGNTLYIGVYLGILAYDLNISELAAALVAVQDKKTVLEKRTCLYCKARIVRQVGSLVIYLQEDAV